MPLPPVEYSRTPMHTRSVRIDAYRREDGYWDLEAELVDVKTHDTALQSGVRKAGDAMHAMRLRVTIDGAFNIVDALAVFDAVPYPGYCEAIADDYRKLVGLNLMRGFRAELRGRLGGRDGCTHVTELAQLLPTTAVQAFAGDEQQREKMERHVAGEGGRPFQIDRCHALRADAPAVERYYPMWFRSKQRDAGTDPQSSDLAGHSQQHSDAADNSSASTEERP